MRGAGVARGRLRRGLCLAGAAALALCPAAARAQETGTPGLGLPQALASAVERGVSVRLAREALAASRGGATAAGGAFDARLRTFVRTGRDQTLEFRGPGAPAVDPSRTSTVSYGVRMEKRFRSGLVVGPQIEATRVGNTPRVEARNNAAEVSLAAQMPLLGGRGSVNTASERASLEGLRASQDELLHARARSVVSAANAYWEYVGARGRLEVQRQAEARARRLVEQTRVLVAAAERPAADLNQLLATLAGREAARIAAEQAVVAAREALGLAMGLAGGEAAVLAPPATPFPAAVAVGAEAGTDSLVARALAARADLRAARRQVQGARILAQADRDRMRSRLDLSVGLGYVGAEPGGDFEQLFTPLYRNQSSRSATVELTWERAARNSLARGEAQQSLALLRQREIEAEELAREIRAGVTVAAEALRHGRMELERADTAVRLWHTVVEAEERKFALGMSTLFDVLQAEEGLTGAMLTRIAAQERYAAALARLSYETGALVSPEDGRVDVGALARPPE